MSNIVFKYAEVENFKSIGERTRFDYMLHSGLNYVYGQNLDVPGTENGSGKSNFFAQLISYGLYGKTLNNTNNIYVPNRVYSALHPKIPCYVEIAMDINGDEYIVKTYCGNKIRNRVELFKNKEEITKSSIHETRKYFINEVLRCPFELFKNSIVLSSSDVDNFFLMGKGKKREWIDNIFRMNVFSTILRNIRNDLNNIDKELLLIQRSCKSLRESLESFNIKKSNFQQDQIVKVDEIISKLAFKNKRLLELKVSLTTDEEKMLHEVSKLDEWNSKHKDVAETEIKIEHLIKTIDQESKNCEHLYKKHYEVLELLCQECQSKVDSKFNINENKQKVEVNKSKKEEQLIVLSKLKAAKKIIEDKLLKLKNNKKLIDEKIKEVEHNKWVVNHLKSDIANLEKNKIEESNKANPFDEIIKDDQVKLEANEKTLNELQKRKLELSILEQVVSEDGAKKFIIKDLIDGMNNLIRKYLEEMGARYTAIFNDNFDCTFLTDTGECEYTSFSSGERKRIDIAILLTFKDILSSTNNINSNIIILDEIFDSNIDNYAIRALISILKRDIAESKKTAFLVSFRGIDIEEFDNSIEIHKKNNMSRIVRDVQTGIVPIDEDVDELIKM